MNYGIVAISFCVLIACCTSTLADDISGAYDVAGTEPSGMRYIGTAEIKMNGASKATVKMVLKSGNSLGKCMVVEDGIACFSNAGGNQYTIGMYRRLPGGVLEGNWSHSGLKGIGTERLIPQQ